MLPAGVATRTPSQVSSRQALDAVDRDGELRGLPRLAQQRDLVDGDAPRRAARRTVCATIRSGCRVTRTRGLAAARPGPPRGYSFSRKPTVPRFMPKIGTPLADERMQGLQHEAVAAQRDHDVRLLRRGRLVALASADPVPPGRRRLRRRGRRSWSVRSGLGAWACGVVAWRAEYSRAAAIRHTPLAARGGAKGLFLELRPGRVGLDHVSGNVLEPGLFHAAVLVQIELAVDDGPRRCPAERRRDRRRQRRRRSSRRIEARTSPDRP